MPEASTTMSTPPKRCTAAATILSQCAAELGRKLMLSTLAPSFLHSAATLFSASAPPAAMTRLQPAPANTCAASAPNAPVAPVTIAVLPRTSNNDSGFFRKSSAMTFLSCLCRHSEVRTQRASKNEGRAPAASCEGREACHRAGHFRPDMTELFLLHRGDGDRYRADSVAAIDNLARFVRADIAAVARLHDHLLAAGDDSELAGKHVIDLLGRRSIGAGAATRQEMRYAENQVLRAAHFGAEYTQRFIIAMVRCLVWLGLGKLAHDHANFSPFSIR